MIKKVVLLLVLSLVMNVVSVAHASCDEQTIDVASQETAVSVDHSPSQNNNTQADIDCCLNGHHHHAHSLAYISPMGAAHSLDVSALNQYFEQQTYSSLTHFPPSKPPKA